MLPIDSPTPDLSALDLLANGCAVVRADGWILFCNEALEHTLCLSRSQLREGLRLQDFLLQPDLLLQGIAELQGGKTSVWRCEVNLQSGGRVVPQHMVLRAAAALDGYLVELLDISRIDQSERELRSQQQSASSRELIRNLAHEIKNPLGGIRGSAQLLQAEIGPELQEYLQVILGETDRLQNLVDQLLVPHRQSYLPVHLNVHEVCEYVRRVTLAQYPQGLELQRDYDLSLPELRADKAQLIQTLLNIVQNAAEVLQPRIAAGDARIVLRTRAAHQSTFGGKRHRLAIKLEIIDNGPGIAGDLLDTIFLPLVSRREGGSGLGLALAQAFILQHGGHIDAANQPSGGAVFTIFLPLDSASE